MHRTFFGMLYSNIKLMQTKTRKVFLYFLNINSFMHIDNALLLVFDFEAFGKVPYNILHACIFAVENLSNEMSITNRFGVLLVGVNRVRRKRDSGGNFRIGIQRPLKTHPVTFLWVRCDQSKYD